MAKKRAVRNLLKWQGPAKPAEPEFEKIGRKACKNFAPDLQTVAAFSRSQASPRGFRHPKLDWGGENVEEEEEEDDETSFLHEGPKKKQAKKK